MSNWRNDSKAGVDLIGFFPAEVTLKAYYLNSATTWLKLRSSSLMLSLVNIGSTCIYHVINVKCVVFLLLSKPGTNILRYCNR